MMNHTLLSVDEFIARRQRLFEAMPDNAIAFIRSGEELTRSNDTEYHFCPNKNFFYLTGFNEPDALLVLKKSGNKQIKQSLLFCREKDPLQEVWHGKRVGPAAAKDVYGFDKTYPNNKQDELIEDLLCEAETALYCFDDEYMQALVSGWISHVASQNRIGKKAPAAMQNCADLIHELRLIKSSAEIDIMRQANVISGQAHQRAMKATSHGKFEYQIEAELLHEFAVNGARFAAYNSIVAGGDNANILHYTDNNQALNDGDVLLIDAGCELAGYAADITRTFPVSGQFTAEQKSIYQLVLDAQIAAIDAIKPNQTFAKLNDVVCDILTKGLHDLGILSGELETLLKEKACKKYFIHGLGHWLGLDVHDVGDYHANEKRQQLRPFQAGMVMTIEPGLYISMDAEVDKKWRGIGVRIEDNVLVTPTGVENLTVNAPKTVDDIEQLMNS